MSGHRHNPHTPRPAAAPPEPVRAKALVARLNAITTRFYWDQLANSWVPGYLRARGFGADVPQRWHIGYAPADWDALVRHLRARGCPGALIEAAGLARRTPSGRLRDTFRDRVMLPIRSPNGTVAGFIGRAPAEASLRIPKYLNSPRTCLYDKSTMLFGLGEAHAALSRGARPVLVEGPFDAIAVTTASPDRCAGLAPCGTALSTRHVQGLSEYADLAATGVTVAFDPDDAGRKAAVRAYHLLVPFTTILTAIDLPAGRAPAQLLAERGAAAVARIFGAAGDPLADLVIDEDVRRWARWLDHPEGLINALRSAARIIATMPLDHIPRQVMRLANRLSLDSALVTNAVANAVADALPEAHQPRPRAPLEES